MYSVYIRIENISGNHTNNLCFNNKYKFSLIFTFNKNAK